MQIRFRQIEREDLPQLRDWRNDDRLRRNFREYRLLSMWHQEGWYERINELQSTEMFIVEADHRVEQWSVMALATEGAGPEMAIARIPVGVCGLCYINWVDRTAEVSIYIAPEYQKQGLGKATLELLRQKAFGEFNLRRLWAEVYSFNEASLKLFDGAGYAREGVLRKHVWKLNGWHDSIIFGLIREDAVNVET